MSWTQLAEQYVPSQVPKREFYKIGDLAEFSGLKPYVLRYWETEFSILKPIKGENGQRTYRYKDLCAVFYIQRLLYTERYSLEGARRKIQQIEKGEPVFPEKSPVVVGQPALGDVVAAPIVQPTVLINKPIETTKAEPLIPAKPGWKMGLYTALEIRQILGQGRQSLERLRGMVEQL